MHFKIAHTKKVNFFYQYVFKRAFDLILSAFLLMVLLPLLLIVAGIIYFDDPGNVIFKQTRVGKNQSNFTIFKFRSMKLDTPSISTEEMVKLGLNKITRAGSFLRRTSLDELPQLLNVLLGDMSIVGPRPALPTQLPVLNARRQNQAYRLKPGMTGLAQVMGRDNLTDEEKVQFDEIYAQNVSFIFDLKIILRTALVVINGLGAK